MEYAGRTLEGIKAEILNRAGRVNPFEWVKKEDVAEVAERLQSLDPDHWGAGIHLTFQEEWLRPALTQRASQYLLGPRSLLEARAYMFRVNSLEEVLRLARQLSLKDQGFLEKPNAPLLLVNGKKDDQHPIEDFFLLLDHGEPKEVRIYPEAGHMGRQPGKPNHEILDLITRWIKRKLS